MNYKSIYNSLISKRKKYSFSGYGEKHHIIPKALGGNDDKSNIVKLTAREHFIAHRLLAKIHGGKMWYALWFMSMPSSKSANNVNITSRTYETIKTKSADYKSLSMKGDNNHFYGKKHDKDTINKISKRKYHKKEDHHFYGKKRSNDDLWVSMMVRKYKPRDVTVDLTVKDRIHRLVGYVETRGKNNRVWRGKTKEQKQLCSYFSSQVAKANKKQIKTITCPHCDKSGSISNMKRWHFNNCKVKN